MRMTTEDFYRSRVKPALNPVARSIVLLALCAGTSGCTSVPDVNGIVDQSFSAKAKPQIMGARGPLTARQSKALFAGMGADVHDADQLQRHLLVEQAVADSPLVAGNSAVLLQDGIQTFRSMFAAIRSAKDHINLEYFIFEDVESDGKKLSDLLMEKRAEGVAVNVIYDSFGSSGTAAPFLDQLKQAGVILVQFNPIDPLKGPKSWSPNNRDHRKILIIDGAVAIVGGINLSTTYQRYSFGKSGAPEGASQQHWRDTDLKIAGPAVARLQRLFLDHWKEQKGPALDEAKFFPVIAAKGDEVVRIIGSAPADPRPRYYITLLSAIRNAEKTVWLDAAYFVPTGQEKRDLMAAARRGVDVRIMLPDRSDSDRSLAVQHSHYSDLMESGVKVYEIHDEVLHSKAMVIDGVWSVIGSSNFDHRSVIYNDEVDAVVLGSNTGHALEGMFEADMQKAHQIDRAAWKKRPFIKKVNEKLSRLMQNLL